MTKPLWEKFARMSADEMATEIRTMSHSLTEAEASELLKAWGKALMWHKVQVEKAAQTVALLKENGTLIETDIGYVFTEKAELHLT